MKKNDVIAVIFVSLFVGAGLLIWLISHTYAKVLRDLNGDQNMNQLPNK